MEKGGALVEEEEKEDKSNLSFFFSFSSSPFRKALSHSSQKEKGGGI